MENVLGDFGFPQFEAGCIRFWQTEAGWGRVILVDTVQRILVDM